MSRTVSPADMAMRRITCGVYMLSAQVDGRDNGCIVNTVLQATSTPKGLIVISNKSSLTHDMVKESGRFCVSMLDTTAPLEVFERFGMQSGRDVDKFKDYEIAERSESGLLYLAKHANAMAVVQVEQTLDLGTHTLFAGQVIEAKPLSDEPAMSYSYYHENVRGQQKKPEKKGWVCTVCGYVYEGEELPEDFVCPWCGHGASDFERAK